MLLMLRQRSAMPATPFVRAQPGAGARDRSKAQASTFVRTRSRKIQKKKARAPTARNPHHRAGSGGWRLACSTTSAVLVNSGVGGGRSLLAVRGTTFDRSRVTWTLFLQASLTWYARWPVDDKTFLAFFDFQRCLVVCAPGQVGLILGRVQGSSAQNVLCLVVAV